MFFISLGVMGGVVVVPAAICKLYFTYVPTYSLEDNFNFNYICDVIMLLSILVFIAIASALD